MCGYMQRVRAAKVPKLQRILEEWEIGELPDGWWWPGTQVTGVLVGGEGGDVRAINATWWFLLAQKDGELKPDRKITCFNARNLTGRLWNAPLKTHRCLLPMTAIVETKEKASYLMEAGEGLFLGGLYRAWQHNGETAYSCTVITCRPHERFSVYHDKSIPLLLPPDRDILTDWLDPGRTDIGYLQDLIDTPALPTDLTVTPVKNSQTLLPLGTSTTLPGDPSGPGLLQ